MLIACPNCSTAFRVSAAALGDSGRSVRCAQCRNVWFATPDSMIAEAVAAPAAAPASPQKAAAPPPPPPAPPPPPEAPKGDWGASFAEEATGSDSHDPPRAAPEVHADTLPRVASPPLQPKRGRRMALPFNPLIRKKRAGHMPDTRSAKVSPWTYVTLAGLVILSGFIIGRQTVVSAIPGAANIYAMLGFQVNLRGLEFRNLTTAKEIQDDVTVLVVEGQIGNLQNKPADVPRLRLAVRDASGREIYTWTAPPAKPKLQPYETLPFRSRLASPPLEGKDVFVRFLTSSDLGQ